jgi:hypothetical protein
MDLNWFAIILSLLINLIKRFSTKLANLACSKLYSFQTNELNVYISEITALKRERDSYNPIDEFAKYALCDRKINKLMDKVKESKSDLSAQRMKKIMYFKGFFVILISLMSILLIWSNYNHPIFDFSELITKNNLDENLSVFYPLDRILSFPNLHLRNSIGVTAWLFILNRFLDIFLNKIQFMFTSKKELEIKDDFVN